MATKKLKVQKAKGTVHTTEKQNGQVTSEKEQTINLDTVKLEEPVATVLYKLGETINKGNFQSSRIDVGIYIPCRILDINKTYDLAKSWVDIRMKQELDKQKETEKQEQKVLTEDHPF
jgi:hypothetical protein